MALFIFLLIAINTVWLLGYRRKKISQEEAERIDELVSVIIPTINSKK